MTDLENPRLGLRELDDLEFKLSTNQATAKDYERLDLFISSVTSERNFIMNKLKQNNIYDYEQFISERNKSDEFKNKISIGGVLGAITGALSILKNYTKIHKL